MTPVQLSDLFARVRKNHPLVHHITNYVTVNDCANITICAGGAPIMADAIEEVAEMTGIVNALVLNIGTLNKVQVESMIAAGRMANERKIPIILDPVGAGATKFRTDTARRLLDELEITILKGNAGEIGVLAGADAKVRGVDSAGLTGDPIAIAKAYAACAGLTVVVSGATDIVTDGKRVLLVENGHPMMGGISGTGCMAASVTGAFAAESEDPVLAAAAALSAFGVAGERAAAVARGPYSFKVALFDELSGLQPADLKSAAKIRSV
ncbi:MAG: hydroxyethylthiazole kinase [Methanomicrobiales archaeon HGW-Methanomicrobiales-1]|jgi:hydroxyethylthiazole kinase|nr:MAG: hydroxyethylthiazole kinase [Methanomicrobiales archaeon HGW-Methanomicrobiales-1]